MGEGWETRRRRGPGSDWAAVRLASHATIRRFEVDTRHFRGNAPRSCDLETSLDGQLWSSVLQGVALQPDQVHALPLSSPVDAGWVRLTVHPDGGVARLRVLGAPTRLGRRALALSWLNSLPSEQLETVLLGVCASTRWARALAGRRPFGDDLPAQAETVWAGLAPEDWEAALAGHPRIGDRPPAGSQESREQAAAAGGEAELLDEIARGNAAYERTFNRTFVVRATGRSAAEALQLLRDRLGNDPQTELHVAAAQQAEITRLRLSVLLDGPA